MTTQPFFIGQEVYVGDYEGDMLKAVVLKVGWRKVLCFRKSRNIGYEGRTQWYSRSNVHDRTTVDAFREYL